ncbi:unnamed protein product [Orchesella dallaii]|uniref:Uncharacterized protein n=1 Tax=Orchesella dallaii TaxID=48710 RepID=A0ABP1S4C7_9HEXA
MDRNSRFWLYILFLCVLEIKVSTDGQWIPFTGNSQSGGGGFSSSGGHLSGAFIDNARSPYGNLNQHGSHSYGLREPLSPSSGYSTDGAFMQTGSPGFSPSQNFRDPSQFSTGMTNYYEGGAGGDRNRFPQYGQGSSSSMSTKSKSVSGDYCLEPLLSCDTVNTVLYCIQGRCTCPNGWTLSPGNLPLNTVWHPGLRRCVSVVGAGCHIVASMPAPFSSPQFESSGMSTGINSKSSLASTSTSPTKEIASSILRGLMGIPPKGSGYVYCQPGVQCVSHPGYQEVGVCSGSKITLSLSFIIFMCLNYLLV